MVLVSSDEMLPLGSNVLAGRLGAATSSDLETLLLEDACYKLDIVCGSL